MIRLSRSILDALSLSLRAVCFASVPCATGCSPRARLAFAGEYHLVVGTAPARLRAVRECDMAVFVPSFRVLDADAPRPAPLLAGVVMAFLILGVFLLLPQSSGTQNSGTQNSGSGGPWEVAVPRSERPPFQTRPSPARGAAPQSASQATASGPRGSVTPGEPVNSALAVDAAQQSGSPNAAGVASRGVGRAVGLDAAERQRVIHRAIAELKEYYIYPDVGQKMADALLAHEKSGDDDVVRDGEEFANLLTMQMRAVSHDRHLGMDYRPEGVPPTTTGPTPEELARYRSEMRVEHCTFEKVAMLAHNIGYVKFNEFPEASVCRSTAAAVMASVNDADAIIFDLRDNHGGDPHMVALMASYLFDRRTHLNDIYNRTENRTEQFWTQSPMRGNRLADKPAYVLTSAGTFSGAEEFCYDLKNLKRATLVGETTGGGAHPAGPHRIDEHFQIRVPDARPINPITKTDWEGTGVTPDVNVDAEDALKTAEALAARKVRHNRN
jgi:Peptidase family S41/N-terminal domain of Peptidase_S41 in eukaryotic IRBP